MINCIFCEIRNCEWWGVDRFMDSCPYSQDDDEDDEEFENFREYEEEQAELEMEENRELAADPRREESHG